MALGAVWPIQDILQREELILAGEFVSVREAVDKARGRLMTASKEIEQVLHSR